MKPHLVRKGETLSEIAQSYGVSEKDLQDANPKVIKAGKIYAGDKLHVPSGPGPIRRLVRWVTK